MIAAVQIKAARALLEWTQPDLAAVAGVSVPTIVRMESAKGPGRSAAENVDAVQRALESAGIIFLAEDNHSGFGVRLRK